MLIALASIGCGSAPCPDTNHQGSTSGNSDAGQSVDAGPVPDAGTLTLAQDNWACYDGSFQDGNGLTNDHPICGVKDNVYCGTTSGTGFFFDNSGSLNEFMGCYYDPRPGHPEGHNHYYLPLVFPMTTCDPADPIGSRTAQIKDWCEYDSPAFPGLIVFDGWNQDAIDQHDQNPLNPSDAGWTGTLTATPCVPVGVGDGGG